MAYPYSAPANNKVDATPTITDHPAHHNALANALIDLLAELGSGPKGGSADLTARLAALDTAIAGLQPLDADLTAIAALVTTAYGRGLLTDADAAVFTTRLTGLLNGTYVGLRRGLRAPNSVVIFGDSITDNNFKTSGVNTYYSSQGYWNWANFLGLNHRLRLVAERGVNGDKTSDMLARVSTVVADNPGFCIVQGGINDVKNSVANATIEANLTAIYDALDAANIRVIALAVSPYDSASAAQLLSIYTVNRWLKQQARSRPNFVFIDTHTPLVDPSTGVHASGMSSDGTHPSTKGAARMGKVIKDALSPILPTVDQLLESGADTANIMLNGMATGSGGSTAGTPVTNSGIATSWVVERVDSNPITATATTVARTDQVPGFWQQAALTTGYVRIRQDSTAVGSKWNIGDTIYASAAYQIDNDLVAPTIFRFALYCLDSGFTTLAVAYDMFQESDAFADENRPSSGVFRTPSIVIPTNTARLRVGIEYKSVGTVRLSQLGAYLTSAGA